jgi:hypothetical protein
VPKQEEEEIDIDARLFLKPDASIGNAGLPVKGEREPPERGA